MKKEQKETMITNAHVDAVLWQKFKGIYTAKGQNKKEAMTEATNIFNEKHSEDVDQENTSYVQIKVEKDSWQKFRKKLRADRCASINSLMRIYIEKYQEEVLG